MQSSTEKDDAPDKQRYKYYRDNVLIPFIQDSRLQYDNYNHKLGGSIPAECVAASWCDGDLAQISSIISDIDIYNEHRIIANKQNNAWSVLSSLVIWQNASKF